MPLNPMAPTTAPPSPPTLWDRAELALVALALVLMALIPTAEILARLGSGSGISGASMVLQHLTLWVAGLGAALGASKGELLSLSTGSFLPERARGPVKVLTHAAAAAVSAGLVWASWGLLNAERGAASVLIPGVPLWWALTVMPASFAVLGWRLIRHATPRVVGRVGLVLLVAALAGMTAAFPEVVPRLKWELVAGLVGCTVLGMPMFAALGGLALVFFVGDGTPAASVAVEAYRLGTNSTYPAIPLFTLAGYILSAGGSSTRLVRLFGAWFGWMPGGPAVVTAVACAFFTALTGASGVTILSLGGLLMPVLERARYPHRFSLGLLTASGSMGALFPPSLPVLLYALQASVPMERLFVACMVPGVLLVVGTSLYGVWQGKVQGALRTPFDGREAWASLWDARWVVLLPVVVMAGLFGGFITLVDSGSVTVLYALLVEGLLHRDRGFWKRLPEAIRDCAALVGGVLLILAMALGFTNAMVDAEIPMHALAWMKEHVHSRVVFLLAVNGVLVIVGAAMDIYSGILVMVPLLSPMAAAFGVDPVHLGVIFLVNLQLGYLVPPVGENLFLASYRFNVPILDVFRATVPFVVLIAAVTLLVTYWPGLTLVPTAWLLGPG